MGLNEAKPKIFEDIDDKIADTKATIAYNRQEAEFRVSICD